MQIRQINLNGDILTPKKGVIEVLSPEENHPEIPSENCMTIQTKCGHTVIIYEAFIEEKKA